jgi:hypothetical protein
MKKKEENRSVVIAITILQTFTPLFPHIPLYFYTQQSIKIGVKKQREMYLLRRSRRLKTLIDESNDEEHKRTRSRQLRRR